MDDKIIKAKSKQLSRARIKFILSLIFLAFGVLYILSPIDIIPDILGPIGWVDDIGVLVTTALYSGVSFFRLVMAEKDKNAID
jgi:uncharacterized membrane protein YkvA (DUF1232 family)